MVVTQIKQGTTFTQTARWFGSNGASFRRLVDGFVEKCADRFYDYYLSCDSMMDYRKKDVAFENFPSVIEAIDVTFQRGYARGEDFNSKKI